MADYIGIKGGEIQTIAGDPANPIAGQVWYNTTSNTLKGYGAQGTGAWASGGTMITARAQTGGIGTSQTAGMLVGGAPPSGPVGIKAESYDGTSWTELANIDNGRADMGTSLMGSLTAAIMFGGDGRPGGEPQVSDLTESWNGSAWSEVGALNTALRGQTGAGTQTAALALGGQINPTTIPNSVTETWNGSAWAGEGAAFINTQRSVGSGFGTTTAALMAAGRVPPAANSNGTLKTESYDGTSWSEVADANHLRYLGAECGTQTAGLLMGGQGPDGTICEQWNGTSWATIAALPTAQNYHSGFGTVMGAVSASGGSGLDTSYEWTIPDATKTFSTS